MEAPIASHWNAAKKIIYYLKGITSFGMPYSKFNEFKLVRNSDSNWYGDNDD